MTTKCSMSVHGRCMSLYAESVGVVECNGVEVPKTCPLIKMGEVGK